MDKYERVGKLVPESFHFDGGFGARAIQIFKCLVCLCLVDESSLEAHRDICVKEPKNVTIINNIDTVCRLCGKHSPMWYKCCPTHTTQDGPDVVCQRCYYRFHPDDIPDNVTPKPFPPGWRI